MNLRLQTFLCCFLKMWVHHQLFLREGINGFSFLPKSKKSIIKALEDISALSDKELTKFAHESFKISKVFDTKTWSKTLHEFLNNE